MAAGSDAMTKPHHLRTEWALWEYWDQLKGENWKEVLAKICEFKTVEEFWERWAYFPKPDVVFHIPGYGKAQVTRVLESGRERTSGIEQMALFKNGLKPYVGVKDPVTRKPLLTMRMRFDDTVKDFEGAASWGVFFESIVLLVIGESVPGTSEHVLGVYVCDRPKARGYRVDVWLTGEESGAKKFFRNFVSVLGDTLPDDRLGQPVGWREVMPGHD